MWARSTRSTPEYQVIPRGLERTVIGAASALTGGKALGSFAEHQPPLDQSAPSARVVVGVLWMNPVESVRVVQQTARRRCGRRKNRLFGDGAAQIKGDRTILKGTVCMLVDAPHLAVFAVA